MEELFVVSSVIHAGRVRDIPRPAEPFTVETKGGAGADTSEERPEKEEPLNDLPHPLPPPLEGGAAELY